jgi:hypothetical protein
MRRGEFITLLSGAAVTWPLGTHAQRAELPRQIAVLQPQRENDREAQSWVSTFRQRSRGRCIPTLEEHGQSSD